MWTKSKVALAAGIVAAVAGNAFGIIVHRGAGNVAAGEYFEEVDHWVFALPDFWGWPQPRALSASIGGYAKAKLETSFDWNYGAVDHEGNVRYDNPCWISGEAGPTIAGKINSFVGADIDFSHTEPFFFSLATEGGARLTLSEYKNGPVLYSVSGNQSVFGYLPSGNYYLNAIADNNGKFYAIIPTGGSITTAGLGLALVAARRRRV